MDTYKKLKNGSVFRRTRLSVLKSLEDLDLITEIGYSQEIGRPITLKQLFLAGLGPAATVQRRLARLKAHGVIIPKRSDADRRVVELAVNPEVSKALRKYVALMHTGGR